MMFLEVEAVPFPRTGTVRLGLRPEGTFPIVHPVRHPSEVVALELPDVDALSAMNRYECATVLMVRKSLSSLAERCRVVDSCEDCINF